VSEIAPGLLIAVPQLGDPNFHRAVVLMLEHGEEGAMGLVVNHPASLRLSDVAAGQELTVGVGYAHAFAFIGGPVEPERGFVLHDRSDLEEAMEVAPGLFVSGSLETLKTLLLGPPERFRLCLGYSGWGPGQLESELQDGSWLTAPVGAEHVLRTSPAHAWDTVLREMGIDPATLLHGGGLQ
jgi:putative transcriptional regulator